MGEAQQSVQSQRQNHKHATLTNALLMPSGLLGAPGEAAAKRAAEGRNTDQEAAMWPNTVGAQASARAPRQRQDLATIMDAEQTYLCADLQQLQVKATSSSTAAPCATRPMATTAQALGT